MVMWGRLSQIRTIPHLRMPGSHRELADWRLGDNPLEHFKIHISSTDDGDHLFALEPVFSVEQPPKPKASDPSTTRRCRSNNRRMDASISVSVSNATTRNGTREVS